MNEETAYYIVNPAGTIHVVTYDHAKNRLRQVGYRLATDEEIAVYEETHIQRFDRPIARPWSPEPEPEPELAAEAGVNARRVKATDTARKLAEERGIDLRQIEGSGAGGRILLKDVEAAIGDE